MKLKRTIKCVRTYYRTTYISTEINMECVWQSRPESIFTKSVYTNYASWQHHKIIAGAWNVLWNA